MGSHEFETDPGPEEFESYIPPTEDEVLHEDDPNNPGNLTSGEYFDFVATLEETEGDNGLHTIPAQYLPAEDAKPEASA